MVRLFAEVAGVWSKKENDDWWSSDAPTFWWDSKRRRFQFLGLVKLRYFASIGYAIGIDKVKTQAVDSLLPEWDCDGGRKMSLYKLTILGFSLQILFFRYPHIHGQSLSTEGWWIDLFWERFLSKISPKKYDLRLKSRWILFDHCGLFNE